jgi:prepilin-type N-terminal cleavage/methylation domain-containing protein
VRLGQGNAQGQGGYTLVEMLVAISMSTLLVLAIGNFATNSVIGSNQDYNKTLVLTNSKEAVNIVARQIRLSKSVLAANTLADDHAPGAPGDLFSWSGAAGSGTSLILAVPSRDGSGDIIWIDGNHTSVVTDNVIFYLDTASKKLYRRWIVNPTATAAGSTQKTTCPPSLASASCPADADVVDDVANLTTSYLKADGTTTTVPDNTEAVNYTVTETRTINGKAFSGTYSTIATLRNR